MNVGPGRDPWRDLKASAVPPPSSLLPPPAPAFLSDLGSMRPHSLFSHMAPLTGPSWLADSSSLLPPPAPAFENFQDPMQQFQVPGPPRLPPPGSLPSSMLPPGPPPGFPMEVPPGMPPGMPPMGFPPGYPAFCASSVEFLQSSVPQAPPGDPPRSDLEEANRKRRRNPSAVEGLAPTKHIKSGGSVTVYSGYESRTVTPAAKLAKDGSGAAAPAPAVAPAAAPGIGPPVTEALPKQQLAPGWEMKKSRTTGKIYYVNEKLGTSQFEPPVSASSKAKKESRSVIRPKDAPDAQNTDKNGLMGLVRATDKKLGRWQKWQKCNAILNEPDPDEKQDTNVEDKSQFRRRPRKGAHDDD